MRINGLEIPADFLRDVKALRFDRPRGSWGLHQSQNAWGEFMETEISDVCEDAESIQTETDQIPQYFTPQIAEDAQGSADAHGVQPGERPDIWDFSKIVCFAMAGDSAPFCFDFRDNEVEPSAIWWADAFWQRVAPNYGAFVELFDLPPRR